MRSSRRWLAVLTGLMTAALVVAAMPPPQPTQSSEAKPQRPTLRVKKVVRNLDIPWDIAFLPSGAMLFTERDRERIWWRSKSGKRRVVANKPKGVWHRGETGLMAVAADPRFKKNRRFYTCHGHRTRRRHDVRVVRWKLNRKATNATRVRPIVRRLPATSGRHGGCQLAFGRGGKLFIGTGDAATGRNPQRLKSGGGKVLRVNRRTGRGVRSNPFGQARHRMKRRVFTYGHRNVQGLARRPRGGMWSVEHGSYRDDEVNRLRKRGNYGWNPVPGYNESVPMTDHSLPGKQRSARWRSGRSTIAPSGAAWLTGKRWGRWRGALAMAVLGNEHLRILRFRKGKLRAQATPKKLRRYGRLRAAVIGPGNALYLTTSNGNRNDAILRVAPRR